MQHPPGQNEVPPATPPPRPWRETRGGAWVMGLGGMALWGVLGQVLPGMLLVIYLRIHFGGSQTPADLLQQVGTHLGFILLWSASAAMALVGLVHLLGWLSAAPVPEALIWKRWAWMIVAVVACIAGQAMLGWAQVKLWPVPRELDILTSALREADASTLFLVIVLTPIGEEVIFRRFLFSTLARGHSRLAAYVVTMLLFAFVHLNLPGTLAYLWIALCITVAYERTGSVWGAAFVHIANNAYAVATQ